MEKGLSRNPIAKPGEFFGGTHAGEIKEKNNSFYGRDRDWVIKKIGGKTNKRATKPSGECKRKGRGRGLSPEERGKKMGENVLITSGKGLRRCAKKAREKRGEKSAG